ncbi:MAG: hypothetical protein IPH32_16280 [Bacteroidetes bacterium]|nr:hypothetical protein [Bacteroidota bacterium]
MVACFIITLTSCQTDRNEIMALGKKVVMPALTGKDVTMLYSDSTVLKIKLLTPHMQKYEKSKRTCNHYAERFICNFYDDQGKEATTLKADYGVRYELSKKWK